MLLWLGEVMLEYVRLRQVISGYFMLGQESSW